MQYDTLYIMSHYVSPNEIHELNTVVGLPLIWKTGKAVKETVQKMRGGDKYALSSTGQCKAMEDKDI